MRLISVLLMLVSSLAIANEPLAPFSAEFRIYVNKLPTPVKAELVLEPAEGDDYYHMQLKAKSFLLSNTEESYFHWRDCQPRTTRYVHEFKGFGQKRFHHMDFQWNPPRVHNESEDDKESQDIPADTLDELTILLRGRCVFATGDKSYSVTSAYGDKVREHHFEVIDREMLKTPLGKLDTLLVEKKRTGDSKEKRRTLFWVAPQLDYMVVQAKHIESTLLKADMIMIDYNGPKPQSALAD
ncbi:MAG: hypothetical protein AOY29_02310 [Alcanivorax borkumensis]|uniref:DUF3108 domain-containing protein n=1 Tax=Alcanivorax borkumensis (strain ATCC 700651 / DSM 11573 / NCIMB 13689 / SK2) TaxID=393595 RepID=Q0VP74_ALCBS|nr:MULTISPECIES: DUF3108 domain-containing protein [Alcanivorax]EUC70365.1 hypothetical protein Y017_09895 [Alcanivorax sp. 97CO-5]OJH08292.1 MAG: hypothetical protein AOY29_02310 [Alcanivorax borkumensis]PKG02034.1 DUF3108 domain-containing protein [Alcanivorax sp. 97CO-6]CAL17024.1 conserved hypothetical protein [Alcanivorax borkumensis SK2]